MAKSSKPSGSPASLNGAVNTAVSRRSAIDVMAQLGRDGARRQLFLIVRDLAMVAIPIAAAIYFVPAVGLALLGLLVLLALMFAILLLTSPTRLRKIMNDQASLRDVIVLRSGRRKMGRVWMIAAPNRSLVMAIKAEDIQAFISAHTLVNSATSSRIKPAVFDNEADARAAYAEAMRRTAQK